MKKLLGTLLLGISGLYAASVGPSGYTYCAGENQVCLFTGTMKVAYGGSGFFNYLTLTGGTSCNNSTFGDPAVGTIKACYLSPANTTDISQIRTVGPEPGLAWGTVPSNMCSYGEYIRPLNSAFGGGPCTTPFFKMNDVFSTRYSAGVPMSIPGTQAALYCIKIVVNGVTYQGTNSDFSSIGLNVGDPNYQSWYFNTYIPNVLIPGGPYPTNSTTTHPLYLSLDGQGTDYAVWGAKLSGVWTKGTWISGQSQNASDWLKAYQSFYAYAKNNQPRVRLSPHLSGMNSPDGTTFQQMFADAPALTKENFNISSLATMGGYARNQNYYQIQNVYWFANVAPKVFANDPVTRVTQWGTWMDNGDIHTSLAAYAMVRGPNSFFDLLTSGNNPINPSTWLAVVNQLGASTSGPVIISTAINKAVTSGYNLYKRTWQHGVAYLNMTGNAQTISLPAGAKNWAGYSISSLSLADGKGDVVVIPTTTIAGASLRGATAVLQQ